jgi:cysteine synthase A
MKIAQSIVELIGNTPLLELTNFAAGAGARLVAKCEFMNPMSVKDRPVLSMIENAEQRGDIQPGDTLVEATSGNTGMALAFIGAIKGYRVVLCMSEIQSIERRKVLTALGAEVVLTPKAGGTKAAKAKALELNQQISNSFYIGQHSNVDNRTAHINTTGPEIWNDTDGQIDIFVAAMGTCGTLCGVAQVLKAKNPAVEIIGVEPAEAPMLSQGHWQPHRIMGTSPGFVPEIVQREMIDEMVTVTEADAFEACRQLVAKDGVLVGISSGAVADAALKIASRNENSEKLIVCVLADRGERYLSVDGLFDSAK